MPYLLSFYSWVVFFLLTFYQYLLNIIVRSINKSSDYETDFRLFIWISSTLISCFTYYHLICLYCYCWFHWLSLSCDIHTLVGMTVVWTRLRNLPTLGSISSGLMTSSSSLNVMERFFLLRFPFLPLASSSAMPNMDIRLLWAVLNSVKFWRRKNGCKLNWN